MLDLAHIRASLQDRRIDVVAEATGLHRNTIAAVRDGDVENPSYRVMKLLSEYLDGNVK